MHCRLLTSLLLLCTAAAWAAPSSSDSPPPGRYLRSGGNGSLTIQRDRTGTLHFAIESVGANCHTCSLDGTVEHGTGIAIGDTDNDTCRVTLRPAGNGAIPVAAETADSCRNFCGMRASFDGDYRIPPAGCSDNDRRARRAAALRGYRAGSYRAAADGLSALLQQCNRYMDGIERDWLRNDLALAQYHQGNADACLKTLQDTEAGRVADENALRDTLPPCDFDNVRKLAHATWHNQALCRGH